VFYCLLPLNVFILILFPFFKCERNDNKGLSKSKCVINANFYHLEIKETFGNKEIAERLIKNISKDEQATMLVQQKRSKMEIISMQTSTSHWNKSYDDQIFSEKLVYKIIIFYRYICSNNDVIVLFFRNMICIDDIIDTPVSRIKYYKKICKPGCDNRVHCRLIKLKTGKKVLRRQDYVNV